MPDNAAKNLKRNIMPFGYEIDNKWTLFQSESVAEFLTAFDRNHDKVSTNSW